MPKTPKMSLWVHRGPAHRPKSGFTVWQTTRGSRRNNRDVQNCDHIGFPSAPEAPFWPRHDPTRPITQWVTCAGTIPPQAAIHTWRGSVARARSLGTKVPTRYSRPSRRIARSEPAGLPRAAAPRICALCVCVVAPPRCSTPNTRRLHTLMRVSPATRAAARRRRPSASLLSAPRHCTRCQPRRSLESLALTLCLPADGRCSSRCVICRRLHPAARVPARSAAGQCAGRGMHNAACTARHDAVRRPRAGSPRVCVPGRCSRARPSGSPWGSNARANRRRAAAGDVIAVAARAACGAALRVALLPALPLASRAAPAAVATRHPSARCRLSRGARSCAATRAHSCAAPAGGWRTAHRTPAGRRQAAGSCEQGRGGRRLTAAVRVSCCGRRAGWPARQAGPGAGSKEALRRGGCRRRAETAANVRRYRVYRAAIARMPRRQLAAARAVPFDRRARRRCRQRC